jgi:hypothetical protein
MNPVNGIRSGGQLFVFLLDANLDAHATTLPVSISEEVVIFDDHLTAPLSTYISPFGSGWSHWDTNQRPTGRPNASITSNESNESEITPTNWMEFFPMNFTEQT